VKGEVGTSSGKRRGEIPEGDANRIHLRAVKNFANLCVRQRAGKGSQGRRDEAMDARLASDIGFQRLDGNRGEESGLKGDYSARAHMLRTGMKR